MELILLSHLPTRLLEEGFIPAAIDLNVEVTILTDCIHEHILRKESVQAYQHCKLLECDIFNPLSIVRLMAIHQLKCDGILAMTPSLQPSTAIISDYYSLAGPSWHSVLLCSQKNALRHRLNTSGKLAHSRVIHTADPGSEALIEHFPARVQSLESGTGINAEVVHNPEELRTCLAAFCEGFALVEDYVEGELYSLDGLGTTDGFIVLGGSHIQLHESNRESKRRYQWVSNPPYQQEVLALLSGLNLGLGRHHIEYLVTGNGPQIREIHNGLHNENNEFLLNEHLKGDLFRETINLCLGVPTRSLKLPKEEAASAAMEAMA